VEKLMEEDICLVWYRGGGELYGGIMRRKRKMQIDEKKPSPNEIIKYGLPQPRLARVEASSEEALEDGQKRINKK